jgi:hypothetical protein
MILYSLDSESPIFIGFCVQCVQCVPWLSRNVRDEIRDVPTRSWRPRFNNGQGVARGLKEGMHMVGLVRWRRNHPRIKENLSGGVGMVTG